MSAAAAATAIFRLHEGTAPLIISVPHAGLALPEQLVARLTPLALTRVDADWHVDQLYQFGHELGASFLIANHSRYLIDLNRAPDDAALYADAVQTGLCPNLSFSGETLYKDGAGPNAAEIAQRRTHYWQPYHDALRQLIERTRTRCGQVLLLDAHSIRSELPRLFAGRLPDINVGTYDGRSCHARVSAALRATLEAQTLWRWVIDGRFKGGHITRHYGQPAQGVHAVQIELAQCAYMDEGQLGLPTPPPFDAQRSAALRAQLQALLGALLAVHR